MNNVEYPRFTVIIPQKDRAEYLIHTLRTCMIQDYPNFEVIVGDDCSEDNTVEVVHELQKQDPRIKLIAHKQHVGMRMNFELALAEVKPGYVMALGGDDGLVPGCIWRMYEIIQETGTELLTWQQAGYKYPGADGGDAILSVPRKKENELCWIKSSDFLNSISSTLNYMVKECPMFYIKGVASTKLVDRVKSRTPDGCFYYCPTPDGFSGVVLAGEVEKYVFTSEPLSINGDSPKSQGRNYKRTDEKSKQESKQFFEDNARITMHKQLASQQYSPLITLMTADYLLTANDLPNWPGEFKMFSMEHLLRRTFAFMGTAAFERETLDRELNILREIAIQHNLLKLYNELYHSTKRRIVRQRNYSGDINMSRNVIVVNASKVKINNVFDAAIAVPYSYNINDTFNLASIIKIYWNSFKTFIERKRVKVEYLNK